MKTIKISSPTGLPWDTIITDAATGQQIHGVFRMEIVMDARVDTVPYAILHVNCPEFDMKTIPYTKYSKWRRFLHFVFGRTPKPKKEWR